MEEEIILDLSTNQKLKFYYYLKKITKYQVKFVQDFSWRLLNKMNTQVFEFPPTLDKDFLYCSAIYSLKSQGILPKNKKILILLNSVDNIQNISSKFIQIQNFYRNTSQSYQQLKIIPYISRKDLCLNYPQLSTSNSYDFDSFCISQISSWTSNEKKCSFFKNTIDPKVSLDLKKYPEYFIENKICPYYFYLKSIESGDFDILMCQISDYKDYKKRISVSKLLNENLKDENIIKIFDECNNLNEIIIQNYSCLIDETLLIHANFQLDRLNQKIHDYFVDHCDMNIDDESYNLIGPEKEGIKYSLFINQTDIKKSKEDYFPGNIRNNRDYINMLSRLIVFFLTIFKRQKEAKKSICFSSYKIQYEILKTFFLDQSILKFCLEKLINLFNEIKFLKYEEMYDLIHFVYFINYIAHFEDGFIINLSSYKNSYSDKYFMEFLLMEPLKYYPNLENTIFLSGGLGNAQMFMKTTKLSKLIQYKNIEENIDFKKNIFLTNTSITMPTNFAFYGEILKKISAIIPDGIICYFSSKVLMENYIKKWYEQKVFDFILDYKLVFIEESNSERLSQIIVNYKKACEMGRGAFLFLSIRNKASFIDDLYDYYSKGIIFIGFPIETKFTDETVKFKMQYYKQNFDVLDEEFINFDAGRIVTSKIVNKISGRNDKKIIMILEEKLLSEKFESFYPEWIRKSIYDQKEDDTTSVEDRIKMIPDFLNDNKID